jgi:nucleoside-diphosphate-sugar epimerase
VAELLDVDLLRTAFRGADAVIHLAGHAHAISRRVSEAIYQATNVVGTRVVAEAAAAESVRQFIFASSVKAIGDAGDAPLSDESPENPTDAYGRSKLEAERLLYEISGRRGLPVTVLRFPLVYGPGVKGNLRRLFDAVWWRLPIPVGRAINARSLLGIDNLTAFVDRLLQQPLVSERPFLLSDAEAISTEGLVRIIGSGLGRRPRIVKLPLRVLRGLASAGDIVARSGIVILTSAHVDRLVGTMVVDSTRAWSEVGIKPPVSLELGIARTAAWYRSEVRL